MPTIEDAYEPDEATGRAVGEDDPQFLDPTARSLAAETVQEDSESGSGAASAAKTAEADDTSDTGTLAEEPGHPGEATPKPTPTDWANELSTQRIAVELKHIETEIRRLLEGRDPKRKRKLGGTRRWRELEEDLISWRHSGRFEESTLDRLSELIARRHYLFKRLRFVTGTRPIWNT
jgi:hypothetical protein